jgi:pentapeptide MXKDX repeat protein
MRTDGTDITIVRHPQEDQAMPRSRITVASIAALMSLALAGAPALAMDDMKKDTMSKDTMSKDSMKKDTMSKDSTKKDTMSKDNMSKDTMSKDNMKK